MNDQQLIILLIVFLILFVIVLAPSFAVLTWFFLNRKSSKEGNNSSSTAKRLFEGKNVAIKVLILFLLFFPIRFFIKKIINYQTEIFRKTNLSIKYMKDIPDISIPYITFYPFIDNGKIVSYSKYKLFDFIDKDSNSIGDKKECKLSYDSLSYSSGTLADLLKEADCLYRKKKYDDEYNLLMFIIKNKLSNNNDIFPYINYGKYFYYIQSHYIDEAEKLVKERKFLLWSRRLFIMARNRTEFIDFPPLDEDGNYINNIFNKTLLISWFIKDVHDYYFNKDLLIFISSLENLDLISNIRYKHLNERQKACYKYLIGVRFFRKKQYKDCYYYLNENRSIFVDFPDIHDYVFFMQVRCIFWDIFYSKFEIAYEDNVKNGSTGIFLNKVKAFIKQESLRNDVDYYINRIKRKYE